MTDEVHKRDIIYNAREGPYISCDMVLLKPDEKAYIICYLSSVYVSWQMIALSASSRLPNPKNGRSSSCGFCDAPSLNEKEDDQDKQQNDYNATATHAAGLKSFDVLCKKMNLFVRKAVYFGEGALRGKPVIHKTLLKSL